MSRSSGARQAYQIDFTAVACGKRVASSKRRVRWRFGFANARALSQGMTGTDCRGDEHDVTFVWSVSSGKQTVLFDGQEVHFANSRSGVFDYSWTMRGTNHVLKIVAHANPPMQVTPGFRQYDFFIDGLSFFRFPKVQRLGWNPNDPRAPGASTGTHSLAERGRRYKNPDEILQAEVPSNPDEEEAYLQEAIRQSLQEDLPPKSTTAPSTSTDLLGFDEPPAPAPPALLTASVQSVGSNDYFYGAAPHQPNNTNNQYPPSYAGASNPFEASTPLALPPSTNSQASYAPAPSPWAASNAPAPAMPSQQDGPYSGVTQTNQLVPAPYSNPYASMGSGNTYGYDASAPAPMVTNLANVNGYSAQAQGGPSPYGSVTPLGGSNAGPSTEPSSGYATSNPNSTSQWTPPPPIVTTGAAYNMPSAYHMPQQPDVPSAVTPQAVATPSTLGFGSPEANFSGFGSPQQPASAPAAPTYGGIDRPTNEWEPPQQSAVSQTSGLFGRQDDTAAPAPPQETPSSSLVDQAYSKLVDFDSFSISSRKDAPSANPFEMSSSIGGTKSLADIQASKAPLEQKKEIMKSPVPAQAMVVAQQQSSPYGLQQPSGYGQPSYPMPGQQPQTMQPPTQQYGQGYGASQDQFQPNFGPSQGQSQPPAMQQPPQQQYPQGYGQSQEQHQQGYGHHQTPFVGQQAPQMQQASYGQAPYAPAQSQPQMGYGQPYAPQSTFTQPPMMQQQQSQVGFSQATSFF